VARHRRAALLTASRLGGGADADDLVQEAFVKAYRRLGEYRGESSFRGWLLAIVANETRNLHRSRRRRDDVGTRVAALAGESSPTAAGPDDQVLAAEDRQVLLSAVREMSEPDRRVVAYRYLLGMSEAETAAALAVPRGTIKSRTSRALAKLRTRLGVTLAAIVAASAVIIAVPPARHAVAHVINSMLRFAGVDVTSAPIKLPASPHPLPSSGPVTLAQARAAASFPIGVPATLGAPERVEIADPAPNGSPRVVSLFYGTGTIRLDEFDGTLDIGFIKSVRDATWVHVRGETALWMPTPHPLEYVDRAGVTHTETGRIAGPTLLWQSNGVTFRLEGIASPDNAIAVASSVAP
jgi:RNA polymerase sigma factor (sigma-70 family)